MVPLLAPQMPRSASASRVVTTPHQIGVSAPSLTPFDVPILVNACLIHTEISPQTAKFHLELSNRRIHKPFARRAQLAYSRGCIARRYGACHCPGAQGDV